MQKKRNAEPHTDEARGYKYVMETIKMLREKPDPILVSQSFRQVACLGSIHDTVAQLSLP